MQNDQTVAITEAGVGVTAQSFDAKFTDLVIRLIIVGFFAYLSLTLLAPFAIVVIWAVILAVALYPSFAGLRRLLGGRGGRRQPSSRCWASSSSSYRSGRCRSTSPKRRWNWSPIRGPDGGRAATARGGAGVAGDRRKGLRRVEPRLGQPRGRRQTLRSTAAEPPAGTVVGKIAGIGFGMLGFAVSVLVAGFLFVPGPRLGEQVKVFARRIAAERGARFVDLAGATIRNISRGVIGVAVLQALLTGLILSLFDVPGAGVAAFLVLIFCIVQVGPVPVLLPVIIWAWVTRETGPALLLTVLLIPIPVIDNVLKPILMARGLSTPMLVILLGVIGGTVSYGLIGLFLGPILLGIFYELLMAWMRNDPPSAEPAVIV